MAADRQLPRMATLREAAKLTGLSYDHLRQGCLDGTYLHVRAGKKFYINLDRLCDQLNGIREEAAQ